MGLAHRSVRRSEPDGRNAVAARQISTYLIVVRKMPERETTESAVAALGRALGLSLDDEDLANLAEGMRATQQAMASLDSLDLNGVEPAIVFQPRPPAQPR